MSQAAQPTTPATPPRNKPAAKLALVASPPAPKPRKPRAKAVIEPTTEAQRAATAAEIAARTNANRGPRATAQFLAAPPPRISRDKIEGAEHSELELAVAAMKPQYVVCRDGNHRWDPFTVRIASYGFERIKKCACGAIKTWELDKRGRVLGHTPIHYPEGYLLTGLGRLSGDDRAIVRLLAVTREMAELNAKAQPANTGDKP